MICKDCSDAADGWFRSSAVCPDCGRTITLTPKSRRFVNHKVGQFKGIKYGPRCPGFKKKPIEGHAACLGGTHCDCQHGGKK